MDDWADEERVEVPMGAGKGDLEANIAIVGTLLVAHGGWSEGRE